MVSSFVKLWLQLSRLFLKQPTANDTSILKLMRERLRTGLVHNFISAEKTASRSNAYFIAYIIMSAVSGHPDSKSQLVDISGHADVEQSISRCLSRC